MGTLNSNLSSVEFWKANGFVENPFEYSNADQEERLEDYFIKPPYFQSVVGNPKNPAPTVVFAPRGGGKSAQRRMVELNVPDGSLVVSYTGFPLPAATDVGTIGIEYHVSQIIQHVLIGLLSLIADNGSVKLTGANRSVLLDLAQAYLAKVDKSRLLDSLNSLKSMENRSRDFWNGWGGQAGTLVSYAWNSFTGGVGPGPLAMPEMNTPDLRAPIHDFRSLGEIAKESEIDSIYILVDRVDELDQTQNDRKAAYRFIAPLLKNLAVVESKPYAFKFFLTTDLYSLWLDDGGRSDRIRSIQTSWDNATLIEMVDRRLAAYSAQGNFKDIHWITGSDDETIEFLLFAQNSPRDLIRLLDRCITEQLQIDSVSQTVTDQAKTKAIDFFSVERAIELAGSTNLNRLRKIGLADFNVTTAAEHLDVGTQSARKYLQGFEARAIVNRVIENENPGIPGKPAASYAVADIRIARAMYPGETLSWFLGEKVRICSDGHAIIRDWDAWRSSFKHTCDMCGEQGSGDSMPTPLSHS